MCFRLVCLNDIPCFSVVECHGFIFSQAQRRCSIRTRGLVEDRAACRPCSAISADNNKKQQRMLLEGYTELLNQIKHRIISARILAAREINKALIHLHWDIGRDITEKQAVHGRRLAADLRCDLPSDDGYSESNLWRMRKLHTAYSASEFLAQAVPEMTEPPTAILVVGRQERIVDELLAPVPWGHHVELLNKIKCHASRVFYLRAIATFGWIRKTLLNQIKAKCYDRSLSEDKAHNFNAALPILATMSRELGARLRQSLGSFSWSHHCV